MGWFLHSNKKTKRRPPAGRKKKTAPKKKAEWDPQRTLRAIRLVVWLVAIGALAFAWAYGGDWLQRRVAERRAALPRVELHEAPVWLSGYVGEQLRTAVSAAVEADPFDQQSLRRAAEHLRLSPWVQRVRRVVRRPDGVVEVHASYREPVALVEARDGYHLVDRRGVRLPAVYTADTIDRLGLGVIRNVNAAPPRAGRVWRGDDVRAGLELAQVVAEQLWREQVEAIDVANYGGRIDPGRPHLVLRTGEGLVRWGRPPGREKFYEPHTQRKLHHLDLVLERFGTIDADGRVVDIFRDNVLIHPDEDIRSAADQRTARYTEGS